MGLDLFISKTKIIKSFRKINFLVAFFENYYKLDNLDNFQPVDVTKEVAKDLLDKCKQVLGNIYLAKELLPTKDGFFFGSVDYDQYYIRDVQKVQEYIEEELIPEFDKLDKDEIIQFYIWY